MRSHRRQSLLLVLALGLVALVAQLAGVGGTRGSSTTRHAPRPLTLSVIPGGSVPDIGSTRLHRTSVRAARDEVVRMRADATIQARRLRARSTAQVVCGIRYSRAGDASWSLGTPYETVQLGRRGARERIRIERSFTAPASDTYRMSVACHVADPAKGAKVTASGRMRAALGLPAGAATPVE